MIFFFFLENVTDFCKASFEMFTLWWFEIFTSFNKARAEK